MFQWSAFLNKIFYVIPFFITIPVIILIPFFNTPLIIFPHNEYNQRISAYADDKMGGKSNIIDFKVFNEKIIFTYKLQKSDVNSFAGLYFDVSLLDVSLYNMMEIQLTTTQPAQYEVILVSFKDGESRISELDTYHYFYSEIDLKVTSQRYSINLNSLKGKTNNGSLKNNPGLQKPLKPAKLLYLQLKEIIPEDNIEKFRWSLNKVKTIIIERIYFHKSNSIYYLMLIVMSAVYYTFFIILLCARKKNGKVDSLKRIHNLPSIQLNIKTHKEKNIKKIMKILNAHVFDPEFSIHIVNEKTGLSLFKIYQLIKDKYNLSFNQLLNSIRLNEAKRLLKESDLKIYDIAFKTGYNDNTYFCKIFKKYFGMSPNKYRSRYSE